MIVVRSGTQTTAIIQDGEIEPKTIAIDSKIITFQDAELIFKWIDRLEIMADKVKILFKLMLRGFCFVMDLHLIKSVY